MVDVENNDDGKLNEPSASYRSDNLRVFRSFDEAANFELEKALAQSPTERIMETVQLILRTYGVTQEELNRRKKSTKITIIRAG